jgi:hypothetical protein
LTPQVLALFYISVLRKYQFLYIPFALDLLHEEDAEYPFVADPETSEAEGGEIGAPEGCNGLFVVEGDITTGKCGRGASYVPQQATAAAVAATRGRGRGRGGRAGRGRGRGRGGAVVSAALPQPAECASAASSRGRGRGRGRGGRSRVSTVGTAQKPSTRVSKRGLAVDADVVESTGPSSPIAYKRQRLLRNASVVSYQGMDEEVQMPEPECDDEHHLRKCSSDEEGSDSGREAEHEDEEDDVPLSESVKAYNEKVWPAVAANQFLLVSNHPFKKLMPGVHPEDMAVEFGLVRTVEPSAAGRDITVAYYSSTRGNVNGSWSQLRSSGSNRWTGKLNRSSVLTYTAGLTSVNKLDSKTCSVIANHPAMKDSYSRVKGTSGGAYVLTRTSEAARVAEEVRLKWVEKGMDATSSSSNSGDDPASDE